MAHNPRTPGLLAILPSPSLADPTARTQSAGCSSPLHIRPGADGAPIEARGAHGDEVAVLFPEGGELGLRIPEDLEDRGAILRRQMSEVPALVFTAQDCRHTPVDLLHAHFRQGVERGCT